MKETIKRTLWRPMVWILLLAAIGGCRNAFASDNDQWKKKDWAQLMRYKEQNRRVAALPLEERRVVLLGNSITYYWAVKDTAFFVENGYVGRGISGQTSYHFLVRFPQDVLTLHPKVVVINAGTNDVAENSCPYDEQQTFINIISLAQMAQSNGIVPVMTSVLPAARMYWNPNVADCAEKIERLNRRIAAYARRNGLVYVDYYSEMVAGDDRRLDDRYTADGVHPNEAGYEVMERVLQKALSPLLAD